MTHDHRRPRLMLCALAFLCLPGLASAQTTPTPPLIAGERFSVQADHAGADTATFRLLLDGVAVATLPVSAVVGGVITFVRATGTTAGNHTAVVEAVGTTGVPVPSAPPLPFTVNIPPVPPLPPANVRIIRGLLEL